MLRGDEYYPNPETVCLNVGFEKRCRFFEAPMTVLEELFDLQLLEARGRYHDLPFLYKLVNYAVDCADLLVDIDFAVSRGTRSRCVSPEDMQLATFTITVSPGF